MKIIKAIVAAIFICGSAYGSAGNSSGFVLQEDLGARSVGLAGACTSLSGEVILMHYNPASLAEITEPQMATLFYNSGLTGVNFITVSFAQKLGKIGTFGVSIGYLDAGQMDLNFIDGSTVTVTSEQDILATASLGVNVAKRINAGLSLKGLYSTLINTNSTLTAALDAGAVYKGFIIEDIDIGICLQNLGLGLKYLDTIEPLPLVIQAGGSYSFKLDEIKLLVAADGIYDINNRTKKIVIGLEGSYKDFFARAGLPLSSFDDRMATAGIGYKLDEFIFDYGITFGKTLDIAHRISISMKPGESGGKSKSQNYSPKVYK